MIINIKLNTDSSMANSSHTSSRYLSFIILFFVRQLQRQIDINEKHKADSEKLIQGLQDRLNLNLTDISSPSTNTSVRASWGSNLGASDRNNSNLNSNLNLISDYSGRKGVSGLEPKSPGRKSENKYKNDSKSPGRRSGPGSVPIEAKSPGRNRNIQSQGPNISTPVPVPIPLPFPPSFPTFLAGNDYLPIMPPTSTGHGSSSGRGLRDTSTEYHGSGLYMGQGQGLGVGVGVGVSHGVGQGQLLGSMDTITATTTTNVPSTYNSPRQKPRHPVEDIDDCESVTLDPVIPDQGQPISQIESKSDTGVAVSVSAVAFSHTSSTLIMETLDPARNLNREIFSGRESGREGGDQKREREKEMEREIEIIRESRRGSASVNVTEGVNERLRNERRASYPIPESTPAVPASLESSIADLADIMTALSAARTSIIIKKENPNRRKKINSTDISPSSSASSSPSSTSTPSSPPSSEEGK